MLDVQCILKTRIPQNQIHDRISWLHTNNGCYSAKSGYHFWFNRHHDNIEADSNQGWRKLWKLQVPHKARFFLWRLCKNNIPTRNLLRGKGVQTTILCPFCNSDVEHLKHVFIECQFARRCWGLVDANIDTSEVEELPHWLLERLSLATNNQLVSITQVMRGIWMAGNKCVWENKKLEPKIAMEVCLKLITEGEPDFQIGWALRDDKRQFVRGMVKRMVGYVSVMEAEATGVWEALSWIKTNELRHVTVETDALAVTNALRYEKVSQ